MKTLVLLVCLLDVGSEDQCTVVGIDTPNCEAELRNVLINAEENRILVHKAVCGDTMQLNFDEEVPDEHVSATSPGST